MAYQLQSSKIVALDKIQFSDSNLTPNSWYDHLRVPETGRVHLAAIVILSEILYWYRPVYVRDESTGQTIDVKQKFKADRLQKKYGDLENKFGLSRKVIREALVFLQNKGLIEVKLETVTVKDTALSNCMFIDICPEAIEKIMIPASLEEKKGFSRTKQAQRSLPSVQKVTSCQTRVSGDDEQKDTTPSVEKDTTLCTKRHYPSVQKDMTYTETTGTETTTGITSPECLVHSSLNAIALNRASQDIIFEEEEKTAIPNHIPVRQNSTDLEQEISEPDRNLTDDPKNPENSKPRSHGLTIGSTALTLDLAKDFLQTEQNTNETIVHLDTLEGASEVAITSTQQEEGESVSEVKTEGSENVFGSDIQIPLFYLVGGEKKKRQPSNKPGTLSDAFYEECLEAFKEHRSDRVADCEFFGARSKAAIKSFVFEDCSGDKKLGLRCFKMAMKNLKHDVWLNSKVEASKPIRTDSLFGIGGKIYGLYSDELNRETIERSQRVVKSRQLAKMHFREEMAQYVSDRGWVDPITGEHIYHEEFTYKTNLSEWWELIEVLGFDLTFDIRIEVEECEGLNLYKDPYTYDRVFVLIGDRKGDFIQAVESFIPKVLKVFAAKVQTSGLDVRNDEQARNAIVAEYLESEELAAAGGIEVERFHKNGSGDPNRY